jgi:catechol 2,3-dioxygenase-like lactoylglutathione lyase family enzyme
MEVRGLTPILNVSDIDASFAWFESIGWEQRFRWQGDGGFAAVGCGEIEVFLCQGAQGSRGERRPRFEGDDDTGGVWMSWWLSSPEAVDAAHARAVELGLDVTWPPTDEPWGVREFHLRHPDGHTFRVSAAVGSP